jgi:hypothetical protein
MYVCMYVHEHACMFVCIKVWDVFQLRTHVHTHAHARTHIYFTIGILPPSMYVCLCVYIYIQTYTYVHTCIHTYTNSVYRKQTGCCWMSFFAAKMGIPAAFRTYLAGLVCFMCVCVYVCVYVCICRLSDMLTGLACFMCACVCILYVYGHSCRLSYMPSWIGVFHVYVHVYVFGHSFRLSYITY